MNPLVLESFLDFLHIFAYIFIQTYYYLNFMKFMTEKVLFKKSQVLVKMNEKFCGYNSPSKLVGHHPNFGHWSV